MHRVAGTLKASCSGGREPDRSGQFGNLPIIHNICIIADGFSVKDCFCLLGQRDLVNAAQRYLGVALAADLPA
jgi:hypothetical protein